MGNHYLLTETPDGNLSKGMRELNGRYTQVFNRRHRRVRFQRLAERAPHKAALDLTAGMEALSDLRVLVAANGFNRMRAACLIQCALATALAEALLSDLSGIINSIAVHPGLRLISSW